MVLGRLATAGGRGGVLRTLVLSGLLSFAGVVGAGCAAQKLEVTQADHYGAAAEVKLDEAQEETLERIAEGMALAGIQAKPVPDHGLMMVARKIANKAVGGGGGGGGAARGPATGAAALAAVDTGAATGPKKKAADDVAVRELMLESGVADAQYHYKAISKGYNDGAPSAEELQALFAGLHASGGELKVGFARIDDGINSARHYAVVVSQRYVTIDQLSRKLEPGASVQLTGRFHDQVEQPTLWIQFADGTVEARALAPAADGAFSESVTLPAATGQLVFEISGRVAGADRLLATAPAGVGEEAKVWPAESATVEAKNALELEKALDGVIANARGAAFQGDAKVLETAKSCAASLAKGTPCASDVTGWHRVLVQESVELTGAAEWASELAALPSVRAVVKDQRVKHLGIAASPIEGKKGQYAVAIVFAGEGGPAPVKAQAVKPQKAPEPVAQPAAPSETAPKEAAPAAAAAPAQPEATPAAQPATEEKKAPAPAVQPATDEKTAPAPAAQPATGEKPTAAPATK